MQTLEHDLSEALEKVDLRNELLLEIQTKLIETLQSIDDQKYSLTSLKEKAGMKSRPLFDQLSGQSSSMGEEDDDVKLINAVLLSVKEMVESLLREQISLEEERDRLLEEGRTSEHQLNKLIQDGYSSLIIGSEVKVGQEVVFKLLDKTFYALRTEKSSYILDQEQSEGILDLDGEGSRYIVGEVYSIDRLGPEAEGRQVYNCKIDFKQ